MNLLLLSKNAVSYSSPSRMNQGESVNRAPCPRLDGMPPIRKEGLRPACSNTQASREVVVVLPWVPATTRECFPRMKHSLRSSGSAQ